MILIDASCREFSICRVMGQKLIGRNRDAEFGTLLIVESR